MAYKKKIPSNRMRGKRNQSKGVVGECIAARVLKSMGLRCIRAIYTGWTIKRNREGKIVGASPTGQVAGDYNAVAPGGISVLVEVKKKDEDRLVYSTLEPHQHKALYDHHEAGGISLLVWVHENIPYVMRYPIDGFKPRSSIKIEEARWLTEQLTNDLGIRNNCNE